jgi:protein TonB
MLILLILPLLAIRAPQRSEPQREAVTLLFDAPRRWNRTPRSTPLKPEPYRDPSLPRPSLSPARPKTAIRTDVPLPGPGVRIDLALAPAAPAAPSLAAVGERTYEYGQVDQGPRLVRQVPPVYPLRARRKNVHGTVQVRFLVERDGTVSRASVVAADPPGLFDQAALDAVRQWRFSPGNIKGSAVRTWVRVPIAFKLD